MGIKKTRYAVNCDKVTTAERLSMEERSGVIVYDTDEHLFYKYNGSGWSAINNSSDLGTGWAQYSDTVITDSNPIVITQGNSASLTNNAGAVIDSHLPTGVSAFYDGTTNKITPENSGDSYVIRVDFVAYTTSNTGYAVLKLDIGGSQGVIFEQGINFPRGTGSANSRNFTSSSLIYSLDTFIANGGSFSVESVRGTTTIYDINFVITRVHKVG